jgi:hypothetical protein
MVTTPISSIPVVVVVIVPVSGVSFAVLSGDLPHLVGNSICLTHKGTTVVTVIKTARKFTTCGSGFIYIPFTSALTTFTIAIGVGIGMIGSVLDDLTLSDGIAVGFCTRFGWLGKD